jgi:uncharacterized protein YndB with AHSA1/START domain
MPRPEDDMDATPTGTIMTTERGPDLVLRRGFRAPAAEVWAMVTESERTATWFGSWTGEAAPGATVQLTMGFEEGTSSTDVLIERCEPPHHLRISTTDEHGSWLLELEVVEQGADASELVFTHHLEAGADLASIGPGWEYYLDMLVAAHAGAPLPEWETYYPAQKAWYEAAATA